MKQFKISYFYLATGMEGIAQAYPEKIIEAKSKDKAIYQYLNSVGIKHETFEDFMEKEKYLREWGISWEKL